ncbi:MAG: endonuclease/exonuclease/phosphatase family protein [Burkholderiaceae bacterium]
MTKILSWNIQNGLGVDGQRSLARIASVIRALDMPPVLCLQEVSRAMPLDADVAAPDQVAELADLFPGYTVVFGPAVDILLPGPDPKGSKAKRAQYGNLVLSRLPVLSVFTHALPQPPRAGRRQMPRQAIEVTVACDDGPLRVMSTHLEYHSKGQRLAQIAALKAIHQEVDALAGAQPEYKNSGPYQRIERAGRAILCGDFNCLPGSDEMALILEAAVPSSRLFDAWAELYPDVTHQPTCGIFDRVQWDEGPHCRDYFFVSNALRDAVVSLDVDSKTSASDHQPIVLTLR